MLGIRLRLEHLKKILVQILDFRPWILDPGFQTLDLGSWILDYGKGYYLYEKI
jgi:hypothetical protein